MWIVVLVFFLVLIIAGIAFMIRESRIKKYRDSVLLIFKEYSDGRYDKLILSKEEKYNKFYNYISDILKEKNIFIDDIKVGRIKDTLLSNSIYGDTKCLARSENNLFYVDSFDKSLGVTEIFIMCQLYKDDFLKKIKNKADTYYSFIQNEYIDNVKVTNMLEKFDYMVQCPDVDFKIFHIDDVDYYETIKEIQPGKKSATNYFNAVIHFKDEEKFPPIHIRMESRFNKFSEILPEKQKKN